jgi:Putative Actinobacterial Holin-X, holin superfamily III
MMQGQQDNRSLGELFSDLARETGTLVRQEVELAKTEMTQKATRVGKDIGFLVAGGAVAYAGFLGILAAIAIGLGQLGVPWWLAALLVGVVVAAVGAFLVQRGLSALRRESLAPERTVTTIKEDVEWVKAQAK